VPDALTPRSFLIPSCQCRPQSRCKVERKVRSISCQSSVFFARDQRNTLVPPPLPSVVFLLSWEMHYCKRIDHLYLRHDSIDTWAVSSPRVPCSVWLACWPCRLCALRWIGKGAMSWAVPGMCGRDRNASFYYLRSHLHQKHSDT
jgi:hypothetical protein